MCAPCGGTDGAADKWIGIVYGGVSQTDWASLLMTGRHWSWRPLSFWTDTYALCTGATSWPLLLVRCQREAFERRQGVVWCGGLLKNHPSPSLPYIASTHAAAAYLISS